MQRGKQNETKLNERYMRSKTGQPVVFGDIIQLFHVKSKKYVTVAPDQLAHDERENIRVCLVSGGNPFSWLQILPRYKIDREGDKILSATEAFLKVAERPNEYIHCADKDPVVGVGLIGLREINCSLESTSWRLSKFQDSPRLIDKKYLLAGQLVSILEPETESHVSVFTSLQATSEGPPNQVDVENSVRSFKMATSGDVVFLPQDDDIFNSNILWVIESKSVVGGGPIAWKSDPVRFRHFNTGVYLSMESAAEEIAHMHTTSVVSSPGTLFNVVEQNSTSNYLTNAKAVQMNRGAHWIQRGEIDSTGSFECKGTKDKSAAINMLIHKYAPGEEEEEEESAAGGVPAISTETFDVCVCMSARNYVIRYLDRTLIPDTPSWTTSTIWPGSDPKELTRFQGILFKICNFFRGYSITADGDQLLEKADLNLRSQRQMMAREQGLLHIVMRLLDVLAPVSAKGLVSGDTQKGKSPSKKLIQSAEDSEKADEKLFIKMGQAVIKELLHLLYCLMDENVISQLLVADSMPTVLAHVGPQPMAAKCVVQMLMKNIKLQETKIGRREISIFTSKLRSSQMNAMYLNLLRACCSCERKGVVTNQCTVAEVLFADMNDIIIQVMADYTHSRKTDWYDTPTSLYIVDRPDPVSPMLGEDLVFKGVPGISISWTSKSVDGSPLGLFGKLSIGLEELYNTVSLRSSQKEIEEEYFPTKESVGNERRAAVAEYFIAELLLAAEMCLDRNYVAMKQLEKLFPYELLVSMLKIDGGDEVKSAAIRLLLMLHVDRDPQNAVLVPCLSRTWSDVAKYEIPRLPHVEDARKNQFALLQQYISIHLRSMANVIWTSQSFNVMCLLNMLVQFNFYASVEMLNDVIVPLIAALDRRSVKHASFSQLGGRSKSSKSMKKAMSRRGKSVKKLDGSASVASPNAGGSAISNITPQEQEKSDEKLEGSVDELPPEDLSHTWQFRTFAFLNSMPVMLSVMLLVLVSIGVAVYQVFVLQFPAALTDFGYFVTGVFVLEYSARCYTFHYLNKYVLSYMTQPLNIIDLVVILVDVIIYALPSGGSGAGFTRALRVARLIRLIRILRTARIMATLTNKEEVEIEAWKYPVRFLKTPEMEIDTMIESLRILNYIQKVIDERNLAMLLRAFMNYDNGQDKAAPHEIFEKVAENMGEFSLGHDDIDNIFIDLIMYENSELVQVVLDVLVSFHSTRYALLKNAKNTQLLASPESERQFRYVEQMLLQLERNAETHELWGKLATPDDIAKNKQTKDYLNELLDLCRVRNAELNFGTDYTPVQHVQDMLRNFGFQDIIFKVLNLVVTIKHDPNEVHDVMLSNEHENTRDLIFRACHLMYWYLLDNPANQDLAFEFLDFFLSHLDSNINAANVLKAMFHDNEKLMRLCPNALIEDYAELICKQGRRPQYLALLGSILNVGDKNMLENQFDTVKHLIAPARLSKICQYICPVTSSEYERKVAQMNPFLNAKDITIDDLPTELAYHLEFIDVLSGCTVGRVNITTVEAKVQSVFSYVDLIGAIIDPRSILLVKIRLGLFLFNSFIEVEMMVAGLESSAIMWEFIKSTVPVLEAAPAELRNIENNGWFAENVVRQKLEYMLVCVMCLEGYFARYFDPSAMKSEDPGPDIVQMEPEAVDALVSALSTHLLEIHECRARCLTKDQRAIIARAVGMLQKAQGMEFIDDTDVEAEAEALHSVDDDSVAGKFQKFVEEITSDEGVQLNAKSESTSFISKIEQMPFLKDEVKGTRDNVRYEPFIRKLVAHVRERFRMVDGEKLLDARCTASTTWLIKAFRTMIENKWGMSIYERDDDGGEEQDIASEQVVTALNSCGATTLCLDLVSLGIDSGLMLEAVKLCVAMLFREGGSLAVQETIYNYLTKSDSTLFFKQLRASVQKLIAWHNWHRVIVLPEGEDPSLPEEVIIIRFMQLMSEGHYRNNQDIMREQPTNEQSINLLDDYVSYLNTVSRLQCRTSTDAAGRVASTILEVIQGPCTGNQEYFVLNTELIETLNRIMRSKVILDCVPEEELDLKKSAIDILQGLLEGQGKQKTVYERVLSVIHIDVIQMMSVPDEAAADTEEEQSEEAIVLQAECMVFLQMLCDYRPSLRKDLGYDGGDVSVKGAEVSCVEVMWNGELQRRFFRVPEICQDLAKSSKDELVENVDRSNQENKLIDFMLRSHDLYKEIKHQQRLKALKLSAIFSRTNQDIATWSAFFLACIINLLLLCFYHTEENAVVLHGTVQTIVNILNSLQVVAAGCTVILTSVVRTPVVFEINMGSSSQFSSSPRMNVLYAALQTALDPVLLYYLLYLAVSLLGIFSTDLFSTFLLLDIVMKNSTTRDVLNSVVYPRKQLGMTVVLGIFVAYIFSFIEFYYFRDEFVGDAAGNCQNLWSCMKVVTGYGLRLGGGIGDIMRHTLGKRYSVDMLYYIIVLIILLNVVFGIIIDTFSELRSIKLERYRDTTETCFICGIDKQVFDRASDSNDGFKKHIKTEQNMWNYFYFILYIWEQDKDDDDGLEQYVRRCIDATDINWFPINKAMSLNLSEEEGETIATELQKDLVKSESNILGKLQAFNTEVNNVLDRIMFSLTAEEKSRRQSVSSGGSGGGSIGRPVVGTPSLTSSVSFKGDDRSVLSRSFQRGRDNESSVGSATSKERDASVRRPKPDPKYDVLFMIREINGLLMDPDELQGVFCRLSGDSGLRTVYAQYVSSGKVVFDNKEKSYVLVCSDVEPNNDRVCRLQILQNSGKITNFLAKIDLKISDLWASKGKIVTKYFTPVQHHGPECDIKISVLIRETDG